MTAPPAFEVVVKDRLLLDPAVAALVADRCYPMKRPTGAALPCITYTVIADPLIWECWSIARLQVSCFATTYLAARTLELEVRRALAALSYVGDGIEIASIDVDTPGFRTHEPDTGVYHHARDAQVTYIYR